MLVTQLTCLGNEISFQVQGKNSFELPLSMVANSNIAGKNEVALEFTPPAPFQQDPKNLSSRQPDELVEMRFYVPGKSMKSRGSDAGIEGEETELDEDGNEISAAEAFHNIIKDKADIGALVGDSIVVFEDVLILTPRWVIIHQMCNVLKWMCTEDDTRWSFSTTLCAYWVNPQIIECHSLPFTEYSSCQRSTTCTCNSSLDWIHPFDRELHGIHSW